MPIYPDTLRFVPVFVRILCASLLLMGALTSAFADVTLDRAEWLKRDPRLVKPVTIVRRHVRVGELVEEAARQSGVSLGTNRHDRGDSEVVTVYARNVALVDLLSGVWSLVSNRQAAWQWEVTGDGKKAPYSYRLDCPVNAREYPATVRGEVRKHFEESMEAAIEVASGAPEGRAEELKAEYPEVRLTDDPTTAAKVKAFASLFPKAERLKLARGETTGETVIPRSRWTREMAAYSDASVELMRKNGAPKGLAPRDPHPETLTVWAEQRAGDIAPVIWFSVGDAGWPVVGSTTMDKHWMDTLVGRWVLEGDAVTDAAREALGVGAEPPRPKLEYRPTFDQPRFRHLDNFNRLTGIPVFARGADGVSFSPIYGKSVADFVKSLRERGQGVKWRDGSLLIVRPDWIVEAAEKADARFPWPAMKRFRDALIASKDYGVTLEDLAHLARGASDTQLETMGGEEDLIQPNMFIPTKGFCAEVARMRPLLAPLLALGGGERAAQVAAAGGVRVRELPKEMRDYLGTKFTGTIPSDYRFRIRVDVLSPERHPGQWNGFSPEGYGFGQIFHFEMGKAGTMRAVGAVMWPPRKIAELDKSRVDPEADLRMSTYRTHGGPTSKAEPEL